jgi:hypothetical protein
MIFRYLKKEKVTQSYAENIRVAQRKNSVFLCGSPDLLCVTEKGFRSLYSLHFFNIFVNDQQTDLP